ncbi:MAG: tol-pal system-associated acyl-CoA thioesterase [Geminicoccaceae bacterium]
MTHVWPIRVYYEDTDAGGVVYHANYLAYAERARSEWLRALGLPHDEVMRRHGGQWAVHHLAITYRRPARLDDLVEVVTSLEGIGGARVKLRQEIVRAGMVLASLAVEVALITTDGRPLRLPPALRAVMEPATGAT